MFAKLAVVAVALTALPAAALPQLKSQAEVVAPGEIKARVLAGAEFVPAPSAEARLYMVTSGGETKTVKWYLPRDIWWQRASVGEWKDHRGNRMRIARVLSAVPKFGREDWFREEIEKRLDEMEKEFKGSEAELADWRREWAGRGAGGFATLPDGRRYYVELDLAEKVRNAEADRLLKAIIRSVASVAAKTPGVASAKWWEESTPQYRFITDLDKGRGAKFIKDSMKQLKAVRAGYELYVPPQKPLGQCTVRLFKSIESYRAYRLSTGVNDQLSDGLWDPTRDELLVVAKDPKQAGATMRHEGFHQYLHYALDYREHAMWFNEGHASMFENVGYDPRKDVVSVQENVNLAKWVDRDPIVIANLLAPVLLMSHDEFYTGDVNLKYCAAWALVYFLERGSYTSDEFAPYREICGNYLAARNTGASPREATLRACAVLNQRNLAEDFIKFWTKYRKAALKVRR